MTATAVADAREERLAPLVVERRLPRRRRSPSSCAEGRSTSSFAPPGGCPAAAGIAPGFERELVGGELRVVDDLRVGLRLALARLQIDDHDRALRRQLDAVDVAGEDRAVLEGLGVVERDRDLEVRLGADQRAAGLLEPAQVEVQAPHEVAGPDALRPVAPRRLERQLAPARLDLGPQARLVGAVGMLEGGVDDRAEPGGGTARVAAEVADDPVELALLERVQPRRRHPHVLPREIAQRPGRGRPATPYHCPGARPATPASASRASCPAARPARAAPSGVGQRAAVLRDQPAQRQRMIDGVALARRAGTRRTRSGRCRRRRRR